MRRGLKDRLEKQWDDPEKRAVLFHIVWLISLGMLVLGYILIILFIFVF